MKRILGCFLIAMIGLSACEGPMGPAGRDGRDGRDGLDGMAVVWDEEFIINRNDWKLFGDPKDPNMIGSYYYYVFDVPQISQKIYKDGLVLCYYRYIDEFGDDVTTVLPYTFYDIDVNQWSEEFPYSIQYSFDITPGSIAFKVVFSDFYTDENLPPTCTFRMYVIY